MSRSLTVGGLFSGIGGWELGLQRAGMEIAWHCEADPFCRRVLEHHWPGVPCFEDVKTLTAGMAEGVDVLCGGFPCQDISLAGKGAGINGSRSGLWSEYARLIGELRPRYVLVENVSALLGRGLDRVLGDLSALGFDAEWDCIPASAVGAPHQRDRVWIVAYPQRDELREQPWRRGGQGGASAPLAAVDGASQHLADPDRSRLEGHRGPDEGAGERSAAASGSSGRTREVADADPLGREWPGPTREWWPRSADGSSRNGGREVPDARCKGLEGHGSASGDAAQESIWWTVEPDVGRVANGIPARVDRLRSLGNALVPQIAEWIGRRIVAYEESLNGDVEMVRRGLRPLL